MEGGGGSPTKMAAPSSDVEAVVLKRYVRTLRANDQCIVCCQAIHPGGDVLFTGGSDCALRAWDPRTGVCLQIVPRAHDDWVRCMRLTRDGRLLFTGSKDKTVRVWSVALEGDCRRCMTPGGSPACDGRHASACVLQLVQVLRGHADWIRCLDVLDDRGRTLFSGSDDCTIREWDLTETLVAVERYRLAISMGASELVARSHTTGVDESVLAHAFLNGEDQVRRPSSNSECCVRTIACPDWVRAFLVCPGHKTFYCSLHDFQTKQVCFATGTVVMVLSGHRGMITTMVVSGMDGAPLTDRSAPTDHILFTGSDDNTVRQWRMPDGMCVRVYSAHSDWIRAIALAPRSQALFSCSQDGTVRCWHLDGGEERDEGAHPWLTLPGPQQEPRERVPEGRRSRGQVIGNCACWDVAVSPDETSVFAAFADGHVRVWHVGDGRDWSTQNHARFPAAFREDVGRLLALHRHCEKAEPQSPLGWVGVNVVQRIAAYLARANLAKR